MKKQMVIGFDLGTTFVGWSIIEFTLNNNEKQNLKIIDMGVRTFDDLASNRSNVKKRREARGRRRRIWRQKIRKQDLFKLLSQYKIVQNEEQFHKFITEAIYDETTNAYFLPVELKIKGLKNQLSKRELTLILHNYIKHRGSLNTIDEIDEKKKGKDDKRRKKLVGFYDSQLLPCENQYVWYKSSGNVLGNNGNYLITNEQFIKEIKIILNNQSNIGVSQAFITDFLNLFSRHRHYSEGPGSEKSLSQYGRTKLDEQGNLIWEDGNLWDKLIGKCTYYPEEKRNHKKSPVTEVFNLLNNLANINLLDPSSASNKRKITIEEKQKILKLEEDFTLAKILKVINKVKKDILSDLNKKLVIEKMKSTKALIKWAKNYKLQSNFDLANEKDLDLLQQIFEIGVEFQNKQERLEAFKKETTKTNNQNIFVGLSDEALSELSQLPIWATKTASLSVKAQKEFINFALHDPNSIGIEQMAFFNEHHTENANDSQFSKYKYFPENIFKNDAISATVKRTFNQATKVLNAILKNKKYQKYELSHVIIEMARELNSEEEKVRIKNELKENKDFLDEILKFHNVEIEQLKGENRLKFLLWMQQNKQDIYDGQEIKLQDLLSNSTEYHIDHAIPISISFVDSMQNKVLTKNLHNIAKGDKTPYQWLSSKGEYEAYKQRCWKLVDDEGHKIKKRKLKNKVDNFLLYEGDPFSELKGFIERQLNDTRYIAREFSNKLKQFFRTSQYWKDHKKVVINSINGSLTTFARNNIFVETSEERKLFKNRNIYNHHAIDATIIAFLGLNSRIEKLLKHKYHDIVPKQINGQDCYIDLETGEIFAKKENFFKEIQKASADFRDQMIAFVDPEVKSKFVRFSRMIISKTNISLSNDTIYSLRKYSDPKNPGNYVYHKIETLNLLKEKAGELNKYFGKESKSKNRDSLLVYQEDRKLYDYLNKIYESYYEKNKNAFEKFLTAEETKLILEKNQINSKYVNKVPIIEFKNSQTLINWVNKLKIKSDEKKFEDIFSLKKHNLAAFYDSLKFAGVRIYQKDNGSYKTIFLSVLNLKWDNKKKLLVVDEDKIQKMLKKHNISNKKFIIIKSGTALIRGNDLFYCTGGGQRARNQLEIKSMFMINQLVSEKTNWKDANKSKQWQLPLSTIINNFKLCKVDVLGNVYDIQSFDEYFAKK